MDALIKSTNILTNVKQMLRLRNNDHNVWLNSLIDQGARDLTTNETLIIKDCVIKAQNNKFYLPSDCKTVLAFRNQGSCIPGVFVDIPFFKHCGCNVQFFNSLVNVLDINGRWANFINSVPDEEKFEIAYQAVDVDSDGDVVINEEAYTALSMYAAFWFANSYPENYDRLTVARWEKHSSLQGNRVRSLAARRKAEQDKNQIRDVMNTVVNGSAPLNLFSGTYSFYFQQRFTPII